MGDYEKTKSTVTLESTYVIFADPTPEQREENVRAEQGYLDRIRKSWSHILRRAAGRKLLRVPSSFGPCIIQGIVVRETMRGFIYANGAHESGVFVDRLPQRRISKKRAHTEACPHWADYPVTK